MKIKTLTLLTLILSQLSSLSVYAQTPEIDSLENLLQKHVQEDTLRVNLLNNTASKYFRHDDEKALQYAKDAGELAEKIGFARGKAESLKNIAYYNMRKADFPKAETYYSEALKIYKKIDDKKRIALCQNNIGVIYRNQSDYQMAIEYFQKALKTREAIGSEYEISSSLLNIGVIYYSWGNYPKAIEYYNKALKIKQKIDDKKGSATCLNNIGVIYQNQGDYPKALEVFQKSLDIREKIGDNQLITMSLLNLGSVYQLQEDFDKALEYYEQALQKTDKTNEPNLLNNIGTIYENKGNYDKALEYNTKALGIRKELGDKYGMTKDLNSIASIYLHLKEYDNALKNFQEGLNIAHEIGAKENIALNLTGLALWSLKTYNAKQAYEFSQKSYKMAVEIGDVQLQKQTAEILSKSSESLGLYFEAYHYHKIFKAMSDSLLNEDKIKKIANLENQYKFEKEKQAIELEQQQKDAIQREEIRRQKAVRNSFIIGFIFVVILAIVIFRNLIQKRKANQILSEQKEEIQTQAEELKSTNEKLIELDKFKENMTGMLVHDMKNPLNSILSLSSGDVDSYSVKNINNSAYIMHTLVNNILDTQKFEEAKFIIEKDSFKIRNVAEKSIENVTIIAQEKNIRIENKINAGIYVLADEYVTIRIFENLLTNAVKYTPVNGIINLTGFKNLSGFARIEISDTGTGIPPEQIPHIFKKFGQVNAKASGRIRSTGLGLTFCKMAVEAHEGKIGVESDGKSGTTFWFTLPISESTTEQAVENANIPKPKENLQLSEDDKQYLATFIPSLQQSNIYETSKIRKILTQIDAGKSHPIQLWKDEITNSLYSCNTEKYEELLQVTSL